VTPPRVVVLYEDKTAGGLHKLVSRMVQETRAEPLWYFRSLPMKGNGKLVKACGDFERMRFFEPHRADHVFAVIDAYEVEKVVPKAPKPRPPKPGDDPTFEAYARELEREVCAHLREVAKAPNDSSFHPIVLFWERESVFLAGREVLARTHSLELPAAVSTSSGVLRTRHPTKVIEEAWEKAYGQPYSKAVNGPPLFDTLAEHRTIWPTLLAAVPCLKELVESLAAL
jgi:hypothetical protein